VVRLPPQIAALEARVQKIIQSQISRGRISGTIQIETVRASGMIRIDQARAEATVDQLRRTAKKLNLADDLTASMLLHIPGLLNTQTTGQVPGEFLQGLENALSAALKKLDAMRRREGKALAADLAARLRQLTAMLKKISNAAPEISGRYREKLFQGLKKAGLENVAADERILKEIALFAERSDITEELTRLASHLQQFSDLLKSEEPSGRSLDFLAQELFREINTIGSKANDLKITQQVVQFKTELERIREQIQNVE
jgi:uncharacterized protein (TIGR00255 family)